VAGAAWTALVADAVGRPPPTREELARVADELGLGLLGHRMRGEVDGVRVEVHAHEGVVTVRASCPPDVRLGLPDPGRPRVETGDPRFDDGAWPEGAPERLLPVLDADTRARVLAHLRVPLGFVAEGWVVRAYRGRLDAGVASHVHVVLDVARRLAAPQPDLVALAMLAREDPHPCVRARALALLARLSPGDAAYTAGELRADASARVRVEAALTLGELPDPRDLAPAGVEDPDGLPPSLARLGEGALLALPPSVSVARALARVGTARSVQPLLDAGFPGEARAIQARIGGEGGALAIVAPGAGALGVAEEAGRVTEVVDR
jgi:hypothetical protein